MPSAAPADSVVRKSTAADLLFLLALAIAARLLFLRLQNPKALSFDLWVWEQVAELVRKGENPYRHPTAFLRWSPLWVQILFFLQRAASAVGVSVVQALQLFLVLVEAGVLATSYYAGRRFLARRDLRLLLLLGLALNPIPILLTCQHGNMDGLVSLTILLFLTMLLRFRQTRDPADWLWAALFLGLGIALKTVPLVLTPILLLRHRDLKPATKVLGALLATGPALYGMSVLYVTGSEEIWKLVFGYRSLPGWFGVTGVLHILGLDQWTTLYSGIFSVALGSAMGAVAYQAARAREIIPERLLLWALLLLAAIPGLGPGYATQYLFWFWPLLVLLCGSGSPRLRLALSAFAGAALATYVLEYALIDALGAFLVRRYPTETLVRISRLLESTKFVTALRAPLFVAYLVVLAAGVRELAAGSPHKRAPREL